LFIALHERDKFRFIRRLTKMKMPLLFGIHCHQPVGNFDHVVDWATEQCYLPFFKEASKSTKFKFAVHYSGWLLEYLRDKHAELFDLMVKCAEKGQIELFTGGYYEPVLSSISSEDRKGQIDKLNKFIEKYFGQTPKGLWLTERVWDPAIIPDIHELGIEYIIVDDYHFLASGYYKNQLYGYYNTEQDGKKIKVFPIDKNLRYYTPFKPEEEVVEYLHEVKDLGGKMAVIFDDGEKFGVWPDTYEWVYKNKWLKNFISAVNKDKEVSFMHFSEAASEIKPEGLAYLPITSYYEMGEWSLFAPRTVQMEKLQAFLKKEDMEDESEIFVKGGIWKNFFTKYPESNRLHKRAVSLSVLGKEYKNDEKFLNALYKAECNDVLWHGIFGGLYLPNLRNNSCRFICEAEKRYEELAGIKFPLTEIKDIDFDGYDEAFVRLTDYNAMFLSRDGGQMAVLEDKRSLFNYQNTLSRRKEAYHEKFNFDKPEDEPESEIDDTGISTIHTDDIYADEEIKDLLINDWYNRNSFVDHFVQEFDGEQFEKCTFGELGDFANQPFEMKETDGKLTFTRNGGLYIGGEKYKTKVVKNYRLSDGTIDFEIKINTDFIEPVNYILEFNFHFMDLAGTSVNSIVLDEGTMLNGGVIKFGDPAQPERELSIETEANESYAFKVRTVSQSESGVDLTDQGICVLLPFRFQAKANIKGRLIIK